MADSVEEQSGSGENHGHAVLVGCIYRFLITHRAAWLYHDGHTGLVSRIDAIPEREEGI